MSKYLEKALDRLYGDSSHVVVDPLKIPCIETSDSSLLCKDPLVSVQLVTYNHEPYIRDCIESVLMQQTNFEFEIVIGEDCSQDQTREICFEYQRKYPEKIRVLWAEENVYNKGGNATRTRWHCRGEYIALLEGDDYWTDPFKLQKQVDLIRKHNAIGCVANYQVLRPDGGLSTCSYCDSDILTQADMFRFYPHTATYVFRLDVLKEIWYPYPNLRTTVDVALMHCMIDQGLVAHLHDVVSVYRITGGGIATSLTQQRKRMVELRQYLDLYLHGPITPRKRFGARVLTGIAFFYKRDTEDWSLELSRKNGSVLDGIAWHIFLKQIFDLRTIRAMFRYVRFRLCA